ncbi:MAG: hypothetical protein R3353_00585 [Salegentibacter mishustinae]|nr:hypothetical protein [Salegentibacter mishustinae]
MSKILYVCYRKTPISSEIEKKVKGICENLNPDNVSSRPVKIFSKNNLTFGIANPPSFLQTKGSNVLLGQLFEKNEKWDEIGRNNLDGNFAIFRSNENKLEISTDCLGTRSVWYYFDEEVFIASTSQKAIVQFLGNFQFDNRIIPWMLSTGSLGPTYCWDKRLKKVPADGAVILNRTEWKINKYSNPVKFSPVKRPEKRQKEILHNALKETFTQIDIDFSKWTITLSGGHDSRANLLLFRTSNQTLNNKIQTITWGTKAALMDNKSDAVIAEKLAQEIGTKHRYCLTEAPNEPVETILNRFLLNGEGQIDHITGYLDGFQLWRDIQERGIEGVVRGDEIFGYNKIYTPLIVRNFMGLTICSDFDNLDKYKYIKSLEQKLPTHLKQKPNETLSTWRDRIFQQYRIPFIQSALADLKYPYIEQVNPFLSREIVSVMRQMPDNLRTDKKLFKEIMKPLDPGIPFSKRDSNASLKNVLRTQEFVALIKEELTSDYAQCIFPESFLNQVIKDLNIQNLEPHTLSLASRIKKIIPMTIKKTLLNTKKSSLNLDPNILAFRILIISRMHRDLSRNIIFNYQYLSTCI